MTFKEEKAGATLVFLNRERQQIDFRAVGQHLVNLYPGLADPIDETRRALLRSIPPQCDWTDYPKGVRLFVATAHGGDRSLMCSNCDNPVCEGRAAGYNSETYAGKLPEIRERLHALKLPKIDSAE